MPSTCTRYCPNCRRAVTFSQMAETVLCRGCNGLHMVEYTLSYRQVTETPEQARARHEAYQAEVRAREEADAARKAERRAQALLKKARRRARLRAVFLGPWTTLRG